MPDVADFVDVAKVIPARLTTLLGARRPSLSRRSNVNNIHKVLDFQLDAKQLRIPITSNDANDLTYF
jgi:hypothetical protein